MNEKSKLNKKINDLDLAESLSQEQKDEIYLSLSKMIDVISQMGSDGSTSTPISPSSTGTTFKCPKCFKSLTVS